MSTQTLSLYARRDEVLARLTAAAAYAGHAAAGRCTPAVAAAQMRALLDAADTYLEVV